LVSVFGTGTIFDISDNSENERIYLSVTTANVSIIFIKGLGDAASVNYPVVRTAEDECRIAVAWKDNDIAMSVNGGAIVTPSVYDQVPTIPTVNQMTIGGIYSGTSFNGEIAEFKGWAARLPNEQLIGLSA